MNEPVVIPAQARTQSSAAAAVVVALFGAVLLYLAGFAPIAAVHDGAHDARHSAAFPCH